jgi:putative protease
MIEADPIKRAPELVAPAGNFQKLKVAIAFGADSVYLSGKSLSLRAQADNFTPDEMGEAIAYAHASGVRVYVLLNVFPHNEQLGEMEEEIARIADLRPDAIVVSDIGAFELAREKAPHVSIHVSTQANVTNWRAAKFWERAGASRIILARELSLKEIAEIASRLAIGIEIFVHGAMCMAYSGRCFMSKHFVGRDSNLGDCAQPCRWTYRLVEETRPNDVLDVEEAANGTLIFSSRDLCMIEHLPKMLSAGVSAFKIEGRMKSAYYLGVTTRAYRRAIDSYNASPGDFTVDPAWLDELRMTSNRDFTTGFYFGEMQAGLTPAGGARRKGGHSFVGIASECDARGARVEARGRFTIGDILECIQPNGDDFAFAVSSMLDTSGAAVEIAQPNSVVILPGLKAQAFSLLQKSA